MAKEKYKSVKITLKRSPIGYEKSQKLTVRALGLRKMHQTVEHVATPQIQGMLKKVSHLLDVEEIN
jgi:large subunit ribosomal protein L30